MYKMDYSTIKRNGVLTYITWMTIMLSKKKKQQIFLKAKHNDTHTLHDSSYKKHPEQANLERQIPGQ